MSTEQHDKDCEFQGGWHTCKCWLRARGQHPAMAGVYAWYFEQHPEDQHCVEDRIDALSEAMHRIDHEQEQRKARLKP